MAGLDIGICGGYKLGASFVGGKLMWMCPHIWMPGAMEGALTRVCEKRAGGERDIRCGNDMEAAGIY